MPNIPLKNPPLDPAKVPAYPIEPSGYPEALRRRLQQWNDAVLAYRLRWSPVYKSPSEPELSYEDVAKQLATLTGKPARSRQQIEYMCRQVADQIMIEQVAQFPG